MIRPDDEARVAATLAAAGLDSTIVAETIRHATLARFEAGLDLMAVGDRVDAIPVIVSGAVRVFWTGESGREITLYRFGPGECCVLSADAILGDRAFPAQARVEETAELALIPAPVFNEWLARSPGWRSMVFGAMSDRLLNLMGTLDAVAFGRLDGRVASLLLQRAGRRPAMVRITHQQIADELGSAREAVSRVLEDMGARGLVRLARGTVEVVRPEALEILAAR